MKEVHKRNGEITTEPGSKYYSIPLEWAKNKIAHSKTIEYFKDKDISLKDYLTKFYENC